jgi:uncharacterized protein (DUF488 family)
MGSSVTEATSAASGRCSTAASSSRLGIDERRIRDRYRWFPDLGNDLVGSERVGVQIRNPAAARDLLELAVADRNRRVIFFCACEYPCQCHRRVVSKLLTARARKDAVPLTVAE